MVPEISLVLPEREVEFTKEAEKLCSNYTKEILEGKLKLLELVEKLGPLIVDEDEFKRYQGTYILSVVMQSLPLRLLSKEEILHLSQFFCERIKDHFMILPPALKGIVAMIKMDNLHPDVPSLVFETVNKHITCQALSFSDRFTYYDLFDSMIRFKTAVAVSMGESFVKNLILAMDGESDPRNLMHLFATIPLIIPLYNLSPALTEEMFSVLECYFPVDFTPSGKMNIKREDLKQGLENCLTSSNLFAPFCINLILEKLESRLKVAVLDSLQLLIRLCNGGKIGDSLNPHIKTFWDLLKEYVFEGDSEISETAINTIAAIVAAVDNNICYEILDKITAGVRIMLTDPSQGVFPRAGAIFGSCSLSSNKAAEHTVTNIVPTLLSVIQMERLHQDKVLTSLIPILKSTVKYDLWNSELKAELSKVLPVLLSVFDKPKSKERCIDCLIILIPVLGDEDRISIYKSILNCSKVTPNEHELVRIIGEKYPDNFISEVLEKCSLNAEDSEINDRYLNLLHWSCTVLPITEYSTNKIISMLENNVNVDKNILMLKDACQNASVEVLLVMNQRCFIVDKLISCFMRVVRLKEDENPIFISTILQCIIRAQPESVQKEILTECISKHFSDIVNKDNISEDKLLMLFEGVIVSLRSSVEVPYVLKICNNLLNMCFTISDTFLMASCCRMIASFINKADDCSYLLETVEKRLISVNKEDFTPAVTLSGWICKALVMRTHPLYNKWINMVIEFLLVEHVTNDAADSFKIILMDSDSLSTKNHCKMGILYKQRVFEFSTKLIECAENESRETNQSAIYLALSYFLRFSPQQLILANLNSLIKVIVKCLEWEDVIITASILEVVCSLLRAKNPLFEDYISTFIPQCLKLAYSPSMKVREEALDCLFLYCEYKDIVIMPYKNQVITGLLKSLDDKKRLVRKKAVQARTRWYLV